MSDSCSTCRFCLEIGTETKQIDLSWFEMFWKAPKNPSWHHTIVCAKYPIHSVFVLAEGLTWHWCGKYESNEEVE